MGYCYLIKFDQKLSHAEYYIGYCNEHPRHRYKRHKAGHGARILRALNERGIGYVIVRIWKRVNRAFERSLKNLKKSRKLDIQLNFLPFK